MNQWQDESDEMKFIPFLQKCLLVGGQNSQFPCWWDQITTFVWGVVAGLVFSFYWVHLKLCRMQRLLHSAHFVHLCQPQQPKRCFHLKKKKKMGVWNVLVTSCLKGFIESLTWNNGELRNALALFSHGLTGKKKENQVNFGWNLSCPTENIQDISIKSTWFYLQELCLLSCAIKIEHVRGPCVYKMLGGVRVQKMRDASNHA